MLTHYADILTTAAAYAADQEPPNEDEITNLSTRAESVNTVVGYLTVAIADAIA